MKLFGHKNRKLIEATGEIRVKFENSKTKEITEILPFASKSEMMKHMKANGYVMLKSGWYYNQETKMWGFTSEFYKGF